MINYWIKDKTRQEIITKTLIRNKGNFELFANYFNLMDELDCSKRTIISRLKQITETAMVIEQNEVNHTLCTRAENKEIVYCLNPLKSNA